MEQADLNSVREMLEAWNEDGVERVGEFWVSDDEWAWEDSPNWPDRQVRLGRKAVEDHLREVMALSGSLEVEVEELTAIGSEVLVVFGFRRHGVDEAVQLEVPNATLVLMDGGRVRRIRVFADRDAAVAAAEG